jgi:hypothetical protein
VAILSTGSSIAQSRVRKDVSIGVHEYYQPIPLIPISLAETYQVPIELMRKLVSRLPQQRWILFLDNLFLTVDVAHVLYQNESRRCGGPLVPTTPRYHHYLKTSNTLIKRSSTAVFYSFNVAGFSYSRGRTIISSSALQPLIHYIDLKRTLWSRSDGDRRTHQRTLESLDLYLTVR